MKRTNHKLLSLLLSAAMVFSLIPAPLALALAMDNAVYVSSAGSDGNTGTQDAPYATLTAAYAGVADGGSIILLDDLSLEETVAFDQDKAVTITSGTGAAVTYVGTDSIQSGADGVISVLAGAVTFENVTLQMPDQKGTNGRPLYIGPGAAVTLGDGATIANGYLAYGGGGVFVDGGDLTMEAGSTVRDCYIANNTDCMGGGVLVANGGRFEMHDGTISGNTIHTTQGFQSFGGGVAVDAVSSFILSGGTITGNTVDTAGGGVYLQPGTVLELSGDVMLADNTASGAANNLYLPENTDHAVLTGTVSGNIGVTCGEPDYNVVVGAPDGYAIQMLDEGAFVYDDATYDIRLKDGNLVLYWYAVDVEIDGSGVISENTDTENPLLQDYDTVLISDAGYQLPDSIIITVGGASLTEGEYTYDKSTGAVHIPGDMVVGDIVITVNGDARYTITVTTTNVTADVTEAVVRRKDTTVITLAAADRYALPAEADITITGSCDHAYAGGILTLTNVASDLAVFMSGAEIYHNIYFDPLEGVCGTASKILAESAATYGVLPIPTREGYTFSGWYAGGKLVLEATANHLVEDLYLTARWDQKTNVHYEIGQWVEYVDSGLNPGYGGGDLHTMTYDGVEKQYYLYRADSYDNGVANGVKSLTALVLETLGADLQMTGLTASGANEYTVTMQPDGSSVFPLYYDRNHYTVTFDPNGGGMGGADTRLSLLYGSLYGTLPSAMRSGYTLIGWFTAANAGAQVQTSDVYKEVGDQTLYAHWMPVGSTHYTVYHMTQNLTDNIVSYDKTPEHYTLVETGTLTGTTAMVVSLYAGAIEGFVPSGGNGYKLTIKADGTSEAFLYYDRIITDVAYDSMGGTTIVSGSRLYYGGTFSALPADPAKVGHTFMGWYDGKDSTARKVTAGTAINSINPTTLTALTLSAHWMPKTYALTFDAHGGTLSGTKNVTYGQAAGELPTATLTGYTFHGWYDEDGKLGVPEGNEITADTVVDSSTIIAIGKDGAETAKTLYAWYDPVQVTMTFDPTPGNPMEQNTMTITYDKPYESTGAFPIPTRTGYTFHSWHFGSADGTALSPTALCKLTADATVYAAYTPNIYEVALEVNGGDPLTPSKLLVTYDSTYGLLPTPTRTGYDFMGWYNAAEEEITAATIVAITARETLTAWWNYKGGTGGGGGGSAAPTPPPEKPSGPLNKTDHMAYIMGFPDGTVRPEANITRAEVAQIFYRLLTAEAHARYDTTKNSFVDCAPGDWYNTASSTLSAMGVVKGRGNDRFDPLTNITRAEFAAIAARFDSDTYAGIDLFSDIEGHWAASEINRAAAKSWVQRDGSGLFRPNDLMTRAEVVTLVNNMLERHVEVDGLLKGMTVFPDNADTKAWYYLAIQEATNAHTYQRTDTAEVWTKPVVK